MNEPTKQTEQGQRPQPPRQEPSPNRKQRRAEAARQRKAAKALR